MDGSNNSSSSGSVSLGSNGSIGGSKSYQRKLVPRTDFLRRPGWCKSGEPIKLVTNHYGIKIDCHKVYMYDVTITPLFYDNRKKEYRPINGPQERRMNKQASENNRQVISKFYETMTGPDDIFYHKETERVIGYAYDGVKTLFTAILLRHEHEDKIYRREKVEIQVNERTKWYEVVMKYTSEVDMTALQAHRQGLLTEPPLDALKALDIILMHQLADKRIVLGNGFIDGTAALRKRISSFKEVAFGHFQTARSCAYGISLNVDRFTSVFHLPGELPEVFTRFYRGSDSVNDEKINKFMRRAVEDPDILRDLIRRFKGVKVSTLHMAKYRKTLKIKDISTRRACDQYFEMQRADKDGRVVTTKTNVVKYFEDMYECTLKYPYVPCLVAGSKQRPVYYPLEVLQIEPNQSTGMLQSEETMEMIHVCSKQTAPERFKIINDEVTRSIKDCEPTLREFQISVDEKPVYVDGKVLDHPKLTYGDDHDFIPRGARWEMDDRKVFKSNVIDNWCVINLSKKIGSSEKDMRNANAFIDDLLKFANKIGVDLRPPDILDDGINNSSGVTKEGRRHREASRRSEPKNYVYDFSSKYKPCSNSRGTTNLKDELFARDIRGHFKCKPNLLFFIIANKDDLMYRELKCIGEIFYGINTQCVTDKSVRNKDDRRYAYLLQNLLLKINTKLEGINCLTFNKREYDFRGDVMIMGADVTHPGKGEQIKSSIAAVTASYDDHCYFYKSAVRVQLGRTEIISDMRGMMRELLNGYRERNKRLPQHVIFYRDGVSDGMFRQLIDSEINDMRQACQDLEDELSIKYKPAITVVVVQKRHHTKFVCEDIKNQIGKGQNVPSGTTVDKMIVHPTDYDFYLCSQESLQGTARPTHYYVLIDENELNTDKLYKLTFALCHSYAISTRCISIPAPVQYAHLAAFRARHHLLLSDAEGCILGRNIKNWNSVPEHRRKDFAAEMTKRIEVRKEISVRMYFI